ncbi:MAG: hypothetical protein WD872_01330 [Pirellulaceae bacterium]
MALRLGDHVVAGELINRRPYMTHGWLALRGEESPIIFQLTGNCGEALRGKHIRFSIPDDRPRYEEPSPLETKSLAWQQVGPTGEITIRQVKTFPCSTAEFDRRAQLGEQPPTEWKPCLYLEWFSQNGRVVIELVDPELEWVAEDEEDRRRAATADAAGEPADSDDDDSDIFVPDDDEELEGGFSPFDVPPPDADEDADDPYGLFPPGLDDELAEDAESDEAQRVATEPGEGEKRSWDEVMPGIDEETKRMYEQWDEVTEGSQDVPFTEVFDPPVKVFNVEQLRELSDAQAEAALKEILMRLALLGVAVAVCEHFSPKLTYRMIAQEILPKYGVHPRLPQIGWVQHYDTSEFCRKCEERFEREYEEEQRKREEQGDEDSPPNSGTQPL